MKKSTWIFIIVLGLLHICDVVSTYLFVNITSLKLESNPIAVLTNNLLITVIITTLIIISLLYIYEKCVFNPFINFVYCSAFVAASAVKIVAIVSNMYSYYHPPTIEFVNSLTPEIRIINYSVVIGFSLIYPIMLSILAFLAHSIDFAQDNKKDRDKSEQFFLHNNICSKPLNSDNSYKIEVYDQKNSNDEYVEIKNTEQQNI